MLLQLPTAIRGTGGENACGEPDAVQTKDLRNKTGDLLSDLQPCFFRSPDFTSM